MDDISFMHIIDPFDDLSCYYRSCLFAKRLICLEKLKKMAITRQFQKKIDVLFIRKEVVKLD